MVDTMIFAMEDPELIYLPTYPSCLPGFLVTAPWCTAHAYSGPTAVNMW